MGKERYFKNTGNDTVDEKGEAVRKMDTISSDPISNEEFLQNQKDEEALFEYLLEYENDAAAYPYLVRGATLRCDCGSHSRKLNLPICHGVYAGTHPVVHEFDCVVGDTGNIATFGVCSSAKNPQKKLFGDKVTLVSETGEENVKGCPCTPVIVGGKWLNPHPHMMISENQPEAENLDPNNRTYFQAITTASFLVCAYSGLIEPQDAGHDSSEGIVAKNSDDNSEKMDPFEEEQLFWQDLWAGNYSDAEKSKKIDEFYGPGFSDEEKKKLEDEVWSSYGSIQDPRYTKLLERVNSVNIEEYKKDFVLEMFPILLEYERKTQIPLEIMFGQICTESSYGQDPLVAKGNNYFGMKGKGSAGSVSIETTEFINGKKVVIIDNFKAYNNMSESISDYTNLLLNNYKMHTTDGTALDWSEALVKGGYATAPDYGESILDVAKYWRIYEGE